MALTITGSCHCGEVAWSLEGEVETATACNCTVCRRYGALWAYGYLSENVKVNGATNSYLRGDRELGIHFCSHCGCVAYWLAVNSSPDGKRRIAVNTRLSDNPERIQSIPIRHFDGFGEFKESPRDHRCVRDMWY